MAPHEIVKAVSEGRAMKRMYAAARLLEHGSLTFGEFMEITGWPRSTCDWALRQLEGLGLVEHEDLPRSRKLYRLA